MRKYFFILGISFLLAACTKQAYSITNITHPANKSIDATQQPDEEFEAFILPYKEKMDGEMNKILTYTPIELPKEGFNSPLANLNCDMILEEANLIYEKRHGKKIDMCLLNWGGMRRAFGKGDLTLKNAYELMPFDNMAWVVTMKGSHMKEVINYLSKSDVGHPIAGMSFAPYDVNSLKINGKPVDANATYTIVTNDFLLNGGDDMQFFKLADSSEDLDRKLRDMIIDHFNRHDTLKVNTDKRILK